MIASIVSLGTALLTALQDADYVATVHNTVTPTVVKGSDYAEIERIAALIARDQHKNVTITTTRYDENALAAFGPLQKHGLTTTERGLVCLCGSRAMGINAAEDHRVLATLQNG